MASRKDTTIPLEAEYQYHLFNRGNNGQNIFYTPDHYAYFLRKYKFYCADYLDTYAYCLLPNHYHLLVAVKPVDAILQAAQLKKQRASKLLLQSLKVAAVDLDLQSLADLEDLNHRENLHLQDLIQALPDTLYPSLASWLVSEQLRRFFIAYSKAINKALHLTGSLFQKYFHRKRITTDSYLTALVWYIHRNPAHHNVDADWEHYPWSSYRSLLSNQPTALQRTAVLEHFGGRTDFINYHRQAALDQQLLEEVVMEI